MSSKEYRKGSVIVSLDEILTHTPRRAVSFLWPEPIHERLDELVQLADCEGARTTRSEIAAAIILACDPDPQALLGALEQYRSATI